ncbi:MAG: alpha/beta hydrolase [Reyranella sp.]|uniref:alpha/beta hydrolase n=1 Tax=Reyranella sp. TaxID=1929291 RepID=UPI00121F9B57|nr:alpha/beta hydrolase [Reyranella sp.]TAJ38534.1 MAG: alpha/beta hydrolase [Reyranella sp.]
MGTIVLAHGAWSAAWAWKKMRPLFRAAGHEFFSPSYTGLGERAHLARPEIDLSTHIQDVLAVLEIENLTDVTLLGHSYGGMVATGVVDKARERIARVVYIDAFAPKDGQSLFDLVGPKAEANMRAGAVKDGDGWRLPINPMPPDTAPEDVAWASPRRRPQPIRTFEQKLKLESNEPPPPRHYIYATRNGPGDVFRQFSERAKSEAGWKSYELDASHNPHITCPDALMALLTRIMPNTWEDK